MCIQWVLTAVNNAACAALPCATLAAHAEGVIQIGGPQGSSGDAPASAQQFRLLVEQVQDYAIYVIDPNGCVATWNTGAERIKGYTAQQIIGKPYTTFFTDEDRLGGKPQRLLQQARDAGRVADQGWRVRADGTRFWADAVLTALHDEHHRLLGYAKVTRDLTERRWGQEQDFLASVSRELAASLDFEHTVQRIAQAVVPRLADWCAVDVLDEHGQLRRVAIAERDPSAGSPAVAQLRRLAPDPSARHGAAAVVRSGQAEFYPAIQEALRAATATDAEHLALLHALALQSLLVVPLVARGTTLGALTCATTQPGWHYTPADLALAEDLSRRAALAIDNAQLYRQAQQQAALHVELNAALREIADARQQALRQAQQERDQAERARAGLQTFLGIVAHDLRNPLTAIRGYAQLANRRRSVPEQVVHLTTAIQEQAQRMNGLIGTLLDAARIGAGELTVQRERTDLVEVARQAVDAGQLSTSKHRLTLAAPERLPGVWDPGRLAEVLHNLVENAIKYSPDGGDIQVHLTAQEETVTIRVTDEGQGMREQELPRLFHLFSRLEPGGRIAGTGLGLYIAHGIVSAHEGRIWAESPGPGQGSTFVVVLPREQGSATA
jgi:PAS domain S-box-containing protein